MRIQKILPLCALLTVLLCGAVWAGDVELQAAPRSGECGATEDDHVTWNLDSSGTLTISGTGEMEDTHSNKDWDALRYEITAINIENGVVNISSYAFDNFPFLEIATISNSVETIGARAFSSCAKLKTVAMGDGVKIIGDGAFEHCYELEDFMLPDNLSVIEGGAFYNCYALRDIVIPDSVRYMGNAVFQGCNIKSVIFGDGISILPNSTLYNCNDLETITIPASITVIEYVYSGDTSPVIYYAGTETQWNAINGDGRADLTDKAERIYFESDGTDNNAAFTLDFPSIKGKTLQSDAWGNLIFDVNVTGNVMQPVKFFLAFYDDNGKFLYSTNDAIKVSPETKTVSVYIGNIDDEILEAMKTLKFIALDDYFRPYCAAQEAVKN